MGQGPVGDNLLIRYLERQASSVMRMLQEDLMLSEEGKYCRDTNAKKSIEDKISAIRTAIEPQRQAFAKQVGVRRTREEEEEEEEEEDWCQCHFCFITGSFTLFPAHCYFYHYYYYYYYYYYHHYYYYYYYYRYKQWMPVLRRTGGQVRGLKRS